MIEFAPPPSPKTPIKLCLPYRYATSLDIYGELSEVWGKPLALSPTGLSFRFVRVVRACVRASDVAHRYVMAKPDTHHFGTTISHHFGITLGLVLIIVDNPTSYNEHIVDHPYAVRSHFGSSSSFERHILVVSIL